MGASLMHRREYYNAMSSHFRWHPSQKRSPAQKEQFSRMSAQKQSTKENLPAATISFALPSPSPLSPSPQADSFSANNDTPNQTTINSLTNRIEDLCSLLHNTVHCEKCAKQSNKTLWRRAQEVGETSTHLASCAEASHGRIKFLEEKNAKITQKNHNLLMWLSCTGHTSAQILHSVQNAVSMSANNQETTTQPVLMLKNKGDISDEARDMVRGLVAGNNVPVSQVSGVIKTVTAALGAEVKGEISTRSVARIMLEGDLAANIQLVDEAQQVQGKLTIMIKIVKC